MLHHMLRAAAQRAFSTLDPYFQYVTMLLHGDGTNGAQNNTFVDSSTNNFTITRNGNTTQGTFSPYGSNWSNYFDGSGDYLQAGTSANLALGSGDFTIEGWFFCTGYNGGAALYSTINTYPSSTGLLFYISNLGVYTIDVNGTILTGSGTATLNTWVHYAVVRNSNTITIYINGSSIGTVSSSTNYSDQYAVIGRTGAGSASNYFLGYISNTRMVKGTAVYTSSFIPSTTPLTAITNTQLLTCQSNRFIDTSSNAFTITKNGDTSVQRFSPFKATSAYSTSVIGGSGYFDGSGDFLSMANNSAFSPSTGDFTLEGWIYHTTASGSNNMYFSQGTGGLALYRNTSGQLELAQDAVAVIITSSATIPSNAWTHVAASRSGTSLKLFINGTQVASATNSTAFSGVASEYIGISGNGSSFPMSGYISDVRLCKSALYTTAFTPNTAPLTTTSQSATNCQFLTNFINAGVLDNAMMNDLETVGNAQISTSVKKYGTGSIYLDGTGDALLALSNPQGDFGSGNFTLEGWFYQTATSNQGYFSKRANISSYSPFLVQYDANQLTAFLSTSGSSWAVTINASTNPSTNTWNHIAFVRNGSTATLYLNGTSVGSASISGSLMTNSTPVVIGAEASDANNCFNGYIDDVRITKGYARYTSNFTPPTAAFPNN